jgi:hypothetical protein
MNSTELYLAYLHYKNFCVSQGMRFSSYYAYFDLHSVARRSDK